MSNKTQWVHIIGADVCTSESVFEAPGTDYGVCDLHDRRVKRVEVEPESSVRIEILHVRDPDGGCDHTVFLNGEPYRNVTVEDVDAGRGYTREDWDESTEFVRNSNYTESFKAAVLANREDPPGGKYIEED